jgi:hypothetical protein
LAADHPPFDGPCAQLTGYAQLLEKYGPVAERAKESDAGTAPEIAAVWYLREKAALAQQDRYADLMRGRDLYLDRLPEQLDAVAHWFECLGDYGDSRAEAARLRALASERRAREDERQRCEGDAPCRAKRLAEDQKQAVQAIVDGICSATAERRDMKVNIASTHKHARAAAVPSEVQDMKDTIRFLDERIAEESAMYHEAAGVAFAPRLCE